MVYNIVTQIDESFSQVTFRQKFQVINKSQTNWLNSSLKATKEVENFICDLITRFGKTPFTEFLHFFGNKIPGLFQVSESFISEPIVHMKYFKLLDFPIWLLPNVF